jgi:hypothetical protein
VATLEAPVPGAPRLLGDDPACIKFDSLIAGNRGLSQPDHAASITHHNLRGDGVNLQGRECGIEKAIAFACDVGAITLSRYSGRGQGEGP